MKAWITSNGELHSPGCPCNECIGANSRWGQDTMGFTHEDGKMIGEDSGHEAGCSCKACALGGKHPKTCDCKWCTEERDKVAQWRKDRADSQVGGNHYDMPIQPIEYILKNNLGFAEGNIIKYVSRYKSKGGVEDLKKARHYLDMLISSLEKV